MATLLGIAGLLALGRLALRSDHPRERDDTRRDTAATSVESVAPATPQLSEGLPAAEPPAIRRAIAPEPAPAARASRATDAAGARERLLRTITSSGKPDRSSAQTRSALQAVRDLRESIADHPELRLAEPECYAAGCIVGMAMNDMASYRKWESAAPVRMKRFWSGAIMMAGPEVQRDNVVGSSMVLLTN
jgi:hypothetical protein